MSEIELNTFHTVHYVQYRNLSTKWRAVHRVSSLTYYRGGDKSVARPGRKKLRLSKLRWTEEGTDLARVGTGGGLL